MSIGYKLTKKGRKLILDYTKSKLPITVTSSDCILARNLCALVWEDFSIKREEDVYFTYSFEPLDEKVEPQSVMALERAGHIERAPLLEVMDKANSAMRRGNRKYSLEDYFRMGMGPRREEEGPILTEEEPGEVEKRKRLEEWRKRHED